MSDNPYATPQVVDPPVHSSSDAEAVRKEHLGTEASIKSIGLLYGLGAFFLLVVAFTPFDEKTEFEQLYLALFGGLSVLYAVVAYALRRFKPWARWIAVVLSVPGLIGFPVGTVISIYFLYLLLGRKGAMVFSASYQEVIAATPHIKYKTSKWVWIALGALLLVFGLIVVMAFVSAR